MMEELFDGATDQAIKSTVNPARNVKEGRIKKSESEPERFSTDRVLERASNKGTGEETGKEKCQA